MKYLLNGQKTDRLIFRLLIPEDFDSWLNFFENKEAVKYFGMEKFGTPRQQCEYWFKTVQHRYDNDLGGLNVLINKETGQFIGQCGLLIQKVDGQMELEIGYSIMPKFWKQGYATEAAQKCRDYAFEKNYAESIISIIHIDNIGSQKVAENNGMVESKKTEFREMPVKIYRIKKADWEKLKR